MPFDLLGALIAGAAPPPTGGERHQVLFQPAFHRESLLTVDLADDSFVHLRVFEASAWAALAGSADVRNAIAAADLADFVALNLPAHTDARAGLTPARAEQLRRDLARDLPGLSAPDDRRGTDGVGLYVAVTTPGAPPQRLESWSPDADIPAHAYFATLHRLASETLLGDAAQTCLEQLFGYLDLGLPLRDHGGAPRRLQIFSRLSSTYEKGLADLFAGPAEDEPVVVDMRNFEGMGTLLYPLFRRFSRRPGPVTWVVSRIGRRQLREAQVPETQLHHDLADAVLHLNTLALRR